MLASITTLALIIYASRLFIIVSFSVVMIGLPSFYFCFKLPKPPKNQRINRGGQGMLIGHRGAVKVESIAENSQRAFEYAIENGADGIECDLRLTKDHVPVIYHDWHVRAFKSFSQKTCPIHAESRDAHPCKETDECGCIHDLNWRELSEIAPQIISVSDFVTKWLSLKQKERVDEGREKIRLWLEWKHLPIEITDRDVQNVLGLFESEWGTEWMEWTVICSFSARILYKIRWSHSKRIECGLIFERAMVRNWVHKRGNIAKHNRVRILLRKLIDPVHTWMCRWVFPDFIGVTWLGMPGFLISDFLVGHYKQNDVSIFCWAVNDVVDVAWLRRKGVSTVCDDVKRHLSSQK